MNSKIKLLATNVGLIPENFKVDKQLDAFAKAIIQECLDVIGDIDENDDKEAGLFAARWAIRKHFED